MDTAPTPTPYTLIEFAFIQLTRDICRALPPCRSESERQGREKAVIAQVAACHPVDTVEFRVAGQFVIASQRADHCLARADEPGLEAKLAQTWTNQANAMMRQADAALRALRRLRAERKKTETDFEASDRNERIEHHLTRLMTHALETDISRQDTESHPSVTETLPRQFESAPVPLPHHRVNRGGEPPPLSPPAPSVSSTDPESHRSETEILPRRTQAPQPEPSRSVPHPVPTLVSCHDPESHTPKTEIHPRHAEPATSQLWRPARPGFDIPWPPPADQEP